MNDSVVWSSVLIAALGFMAGFACGIIVAAVEDYKDELPKL